MKLGIFAFPTDTSLPVSELAQAIEERGFHSMWVPDHSHIPTSRRTPPGGRRGAAGQKLPAEYLRNLDPFGALAAAAAVTDRLLLGTGVCLVAQRHPIWTAKEVATVDLISGGRFRFGIGFGWNREEMAHHGVDFATRRARGREHVLAMRQLWTHEEASFDGEFVRFESSWAWPKPVQRPHPPIWLGGSTVADTLDQVVEYGDGWMPTGPDAMNPAAVDELRRRCEAAGRDPSEITLGVYAPKPDEATLETLAGRGFSWAALMVRPYDELAALDRYLPLLERFDSRD